MNIKFKSALILALPLCLILMAWTGYLDTLSEKAIDDGLKRSLVAYASARSLNAVLSLLESVQVGAGLGANINVTIGQVLNPINTLIEQFSNLMFWTTMAFGTMKLAVAISSSKLVSAALTLLLVVWVYWVYRKKHGSVMLSSILLTVIVFRFAVPATMLFTDVIYWSFLEQTHDKSLEELNKNIDMPSVSEILQDGKGTIKTIKANTEAKAIYLLTLAVVFMLQTVIIPGLLFFMILRGSRLLIDQARVTKIKSQLEVL